jgi:uncharacterized protein
MIIRAGIVNWPSRAIVGLLVGTIWIYQHTLSPLFGPACRFEPSCSRYMALALQKYGLLQGLAKGLRRLSRCHPWHPGGYDPP